MCVQLIVVFSVSSQEKVSAFQLVLQWLVLWAGGHGKNKSYRIKERWLSKTAEKLAYPCF